MKTSLHKRFASLVYMLSIKLHEKKYEDLPYLYQRNGNNTLLIVFSAFTGDVRRYNYVRGFSDIKVDKLFILDPYGYRGSYNLFERGSNHPLKTTKALINEVISGGNYNRIYTAGTSKGGTCALYFGLEIHADAVFSGACQYNLGTYVYRPEFRRIFYGMMGDNAGQPEVNYLNQMMRGVLMYNEKTNTVVHVLYSKKELTYERQIIDLLHDLDGFNIPFIDVERDFEKHEDVAIPFVKYVKDFFSDMV